VINNFIYDIAVVGAGPAGVMSAIRAGWHKKNVILIEKNSSIGKKILLTGRGRCNITNLAPIETFIEVFGKEGSFFRSAFSAFFNRDLIDFFKKGGLPLKAERQGRVFPVTDRASSVVEILKKSLLKNKIKVLYDTRLKDIKKQKGLFELETEKRDKIYAKKVILAAGGASYKITGSSGDGFRLAKKLGHSIISLKPALVPLKTEEVWVKDLAGLSLKNIRLIFKYGRKKITSDIGELIFTHFGLSGPLVLDLSGRIVSLLGKHEKIFLFIDLKPGLKPEELEARLLREFDAQRNARLKNILKSLLPQRLISIFLNIAGLLPQKKINQVSRKERQALIKFLKAFPLTIKGSLPIEEAMVTNGGVSRKEIDPRSMESKIIPGFYFAGEIIDGCASSGGYNLQQAFSTGFLAGESAVYTLRKNRSL